MEADVHQIRALETLSLMRREGLSLTAAAREAGTTPKTVRRRVGRALEKPGSRWAAKPFDRIPRHVRFVTERGEIEVPARDSRTATRIARHHNAVREFARTGDETLLDEFRGRSFTSYGTEYTFLTDEDVIMTLAAVGELSFEHMYLQST